MKDSDRRKAAFLTGTLRPFRDTEIRLEGEYGINSRQSGFTTLDDRLSGWDGKTTYNGVTAATTLPSNANALGVSRRGANYYVFVPFGGPQAIMNYQNDPITLPGGNSTTTPIAGFVQGTLPAFNTAGATFLHAVDVPANRFDTAIANSFFRPPSEEFTISPDAPILTQRFKDLQLTIGQRVGNFFSKWPPMPTGPARSSTASRTAAATTPTSTSIAFGPTAPPIRISCSPTATAP
jgi:hypothetical protein